MQRESALFERIADLVRSVAKIDADVPITPETSLVDDLGVDSLDLVGVILQIQDDFQVSVNEDDLPRLEKLGDLARYVEQRIPAAAA
jgi:acyl carrier protein